MTDTPVDTFVALSAFLTGIAGDVLAPEVDPNEPPLKNVFYDYANTQSGATLQALLSAFAQNRSQPAPVIAKAIFNNADPLVGYLARSIMLQWYIGSWYAPAALQAYATNRALGGPVPSVVISSTAYISGWVWSVAQAHPMGYSNQSFGYWHTQPPSLNSYLSGGN